MAIRTSKYIELKNQAAQIEVFVAEGAMVLSMTKEVEVPGDAPQDEASAGDLHFEVEPVTVTVMLSAEDASDLQRALRSMARTLRQAIKKAKTGGQES